MIYEKLLDFPKDFLWGASTSAYQVEGGWDADGKSPSIIDRYEHPAGYADFTVASDHYHRYKEDIALFIMVVEINTPAFWVGCVAGVGHGCPNQIITHGIMSGIVFYIGIGFIGGHIRHAGTFSVHVPGTFTLVGGQRAAPEKTFRETHTNCLLVQQAGRALQTGARPAEHYAFSEFFSGLRTKVTAADTTMATTTATAAAKMVCWKMGSARMVE